MAKREDIERALFAMGWMKDRFGHFRKEIANAPHRVKMQATSLRIEKQVKIVDKNEWFNRVSDYYKNIIVDSEGLVVRGRRLRARKEA